MTKLLAAGWAGLALAGAVALAATARAETALYETGPAQDSSYVRFLNATPSKATVLSAKGAATATLGVKEGDRVSRYYPAVAGKRLEAAVQVGTAKVAAVVVAKPGEYVTVVVLPGSSGALETHLVRESPADYSAARVSLSLSNLDPKCAKAGMSGGPKEARIVDDVAPFGVARRQVNPVKLAVQVHCDGRAAAAVDLSQLEPGERYSVFLLPPGGSRQAFFVRDAAS
jgi:alginate O-acetyltransferase complex protein AlgF